MRYTSSAATLLAVLFSQASAFWQYGHLFVARVAYDHLQFTIQGRAALQGANNLLKVYKDARPDMIVSEGNYPFVECATFADEIKEKNMTWQSNWHFVDTPYLDEGGSINDYPLFKYDNDTVDKAIVDIASWLSGRGNYKESFVYKNITAHISGEEEAKSFALRLLIHYVGDVHQPLHATARVDSKYPKGDAGGNFFHLVEKLGAKNLHSVWDSILYLWTGTPAMPLSYNDWQTLGTNTGDMEKKYTFSPSDWQTADAHQWAMQSFELSKSAVYPGIKEDTALPDAYVSKNQEVIRRQIVLGGLRLSYLIQQVFSPSSIEEVTFLQ